MSRLAPILLLGVLAGASGACGDEEEPRSAATLRTVPAATETRAAPAAADARLGRPAIVPAQANIFGAGLREAPAPGGGGSGVLPTGWRLPEGARRVVTVLRVTGRVNPITGSAPDNGAAGDGIGSTDVTSSGGISGIVHERNGMFLTGVFLGDAPASGPAPPRLDFTRRERFRSLAPRIAQTFLVGDGRNRVYRVPRGATRLYLGFADAYLYVGAPGWYGNNSGKLRVTVRMARR